MAYCSTHVLNMDLLSIKEHSVMHSAYDMAGDRHSYLLSVFVIRVSRWSMYALSYQYGGFPTIRLNEVRDITAHLLSDVCHNVGVELTLQPITDERLHHSTANTENGARVDIKAQGFWEKL